MSPCIAGCWPSPAGGLTSRPILGFFARVTCSFPGRCKAPLPIAERVVGRVINLPAGPLHPHDLEWLITLIFDRVGLRPDPQHRVRVMVVVREQLSRRPDRSDAVATPACRAIDVRTDAGFRPTTTMSVGFNTSNMFFGVVDVLFNDRCGADVPSPTTAQAFSSRRPAAAFNSSSVRPWL